LRDATETIRPLALPETRHEFPSPRLLPEDLWVTPAGYVLPCSRDR